MLHEYSLLAALSLVFPCQHPYDHGKLLLLLSVSDESPLREVA